MEQISHVLQRISELVQAGNLPDAERLCWDILKSDPQNIDAYYQLSLIAGQAGKFDVAMELLQRALAIESQNATLYNALANIYRTLGYREQAMQAFDKGIRCGNADFVIFNNYGTLLLELGLAEQAISCYLKAIALNPTVPEIYLNLGRVYHDRYQLMDALKAYQRAVELRPDVYTALTSLGNVYKDLGKEEEAQIQYRRALKLNPDFLPAQWGICLAQLPILYTSTAEIDISRQSYRNALEKLDQSILLDTEENIRMAAETVGLYQSFFLAYQDRNDRELQEQYGKLYHRIMKTRYPQWAQPVPMPPWEPGQKIRVGILSRYFHDHSNWKIPIRGWVEASNHERFEWFGYSTGGPKDDSTKLARELFDHYTENMPFEPLCRKILADRLHVLIIPETGMDAMTVRMAALRLAPVQCTSWGHPQTSGLETIDYFLSSDLMEPENGQDCYSEKLIRLPNLSIYYTPVHYPQKYLDLGEYGVQPGKIRYLCCQLLSKYLPQYDFVLPEIAKRVPNAQFLFISHPVGVSDIFRRRLKRVFAEAGLDSNQYVVMLPYLDRPQFASLCSQVDVYLDSMAWSGCNSTLEAIEYSLPIVTLPGSYMRGRHSMAILQQMGVTETIAGSLDEYIAIATQLGLDSQWRQTVSRRMGETKYKLYYDEKPVRALEAFLESCVADTQNSGGSMPVRAAAR